MLESLSELATSGPILAYSLLAASLLALVSIAAGLLRGDVRALLRPSATLKIAVAVALAFVLALLGQALSGDGATPWSLSGLRRLPLYLMALAFGPSAGLVSGGLFAAFEATSGTLGWREAILTLELVALGWLAIYPSPFLTRFAGPINALLAYVLAWGTAGIALLEHEQGAVTIQGLWQQHQEPVLGLLVAAGLLTLVGPVSYAALFPESRIAPKQPSAAIPETRIAVEALDRPTPLRDPSLPIPDLPEQYARQRPTKVLDAPPFDPSDENF